MTSREPPRTAPVFSNTLPILLLRAREAVTDRFRPVFQAQGVTEQQWRVLRTLSTASEVSVTGLATAVFLSGPSLSRILKDLLRRGLILRRVGPADQRLGLISITPAGREVIAVIGPDAYRVADEIQALYGSERMERLQTLLLELEALLAT
jgi:homoprotocatechuate degradation regulator HpaR